MLSSTFQNIFSSLVEKQINVKPDTLLKILEYVQNKEKDTYIYPEVIKERFNLELKNIYELLILLEKKNVVKQVYKLYCPKCKDVSSDIYEDINELEENSTCEFCDRELIDEKNLYKYVVIYFKVTKE